MHNDSAKSECQRVVEASILSKGFSPVSNDVERQSRERDDDHESEVGEEAKVAGPSWGRLVAATDSTRGALKEEECDDAEPKELHDHRHRSLVQPSPTFQSLRPPNHGNDARHDGPNLGSRFGLGGLDELGETLSCGSSAIFEDIV